MSGTATTIDWLRFRTKAEPRAALEAVSTLFGGVGSHLTFGAPQKGVLGFQQALPIKLADVTLGRMDFGGESQRDWVRVDIPGTGCQWVSDWGNVDAIEDLERAELRRVDIALTTWRGEVSHERVVQAHTDGQFTTGGRPPNLQQITHSDPRVGRTCYIGKRTAAKFLRAYEKGYQLAAMCPVGEVTHIDGYPVEDIYRCELELKADGTADIPWETIERRDQYFTGAYRFCAELLPEVEPDILQRRPEKAPQRELAAALATLRHQWGNTLFTALTAYHGDIGAVWEKVCGKEHNRNLLEAGVLLVDHE